MLPALMLSQCLGSTMMLPLEGLFDRLRGRKGHGLYLLRGGNFLNRVSRAKQTGQVGGSVSSVEYGSSNIDSNFIRLQITRTSVSFSWRTVWVNMCSWALLLTAPPQTARVRSTSGFSFIFVVAMSLLQATSGFSNQKSKRK